MPYSDPWGSPGAYSTILVEGAPPTPVFLDRHMKRLTQSLRLLDLNTALPLKFVEDAILNTATSNPETPYMIRVAITHAGLFICKLPQSGKESELRGIFCTVRRRLPSAKSMMDIELHRIVQTLDRNHEECILMSEDGRILEGATSNLLFVQNKNIIAPVRDNLPGITRQILKECLPNDWIWQESDVRVEHLEDVEEILVCGSGKGVSCLKSLPEARWKNKSMKAFNKFVRLFREAKLLYLQQNSKKDALQ